MGAALAHVYLKANFKVTAWNRTQDRKEVMDVVDAGATVSDSVESTLSSAPVIIICVLSYDTIYAILKEVPPASLAHKTIINLTNGTPKEARSMSVWIKQRSVSTYIDGGIMATPTLVSTNQSFIFYSGEKQKEVDKIQDYLLPLGRIDYVGEDPGAAALYDLALLAGMYGMQAGAMTAMAMLDKAEGGRRGLSSTVEENLIPWLQALLPSLTGLARSVEDEDFEAHGHTNAMKSSSLSNVMRTCEDEGVDPGAVRFLTKAVGDTVEENGGDKGLALVLQRFLNY